MGKRPFISATPLQGLPPPRSFVNPLFLVKLRFLCFSRPDIPELILSIRTQLWDALYKMSRGRILVAFLLKKPSSFQLQIISTMMIIFEYSKGYYCSF